MTNTSTRVETIVRYLSGVGDDYSIHNETNLRTDLQLDSLDLIEVVVKVENEFNIEITDDETDSPALATFGGLVAFVQGKLDAQARLINPPNMEIVGAALEQARGRA